LIQGDLDGFTKLKNFDISHNPIEHLKENVFVNESSIEVLSFYNCHLKIIESNVLDPLLNLKKVNFQFNPCISQKVDHFDYKTEDQKLEKLDNLKSNFHGKCQSHSHDKIIFNALNKTFAEFADQETLNENFAECEKLSILQKYSLGIISILMVVIFLSIGGMIFFGVKNRRNSIFNYNRKDEEASERIEF
jgi:hypothetical protein